MSRSLCTSIFQFAALVPIACLVGCGGDIGSVTGTVTAEGKPLPNALVEFYPQTEELTNARSSSAVTAADGTYELRYSRDQEGALVGEHKVVITTGGRAEGDYGKPSKETLPTKYNVATELVRTVNSGSNVIDFELDYEGEIEQPPGVTGY